MRYFSLALFLTFLITSSLEANFFSDLFDFKTPDKESSKQYKEEIDNRVISVDEFFNEDVATPNSHEDEIFIEDDPFAEEFQESEEQVSNVKEKTIFLFYLTKRDKVYLKEEFFIDVKAVITADNIRSIDTTFSGGKDFEVFEKASTWAKIGDKIYRNRLYFKLLSPKSRLPNIKVSYKTDLYSASETILAIRPKVVALKSDDIFCSVIAKDFTLISHHEKKYDDNSTIVVMEINASHSNLGDFHLPFSKRDGIDTHHRVGVNQSIYYYAIVPKSLKIFKFKYFNKTSNKFNIVSFTMDYGDTTLSTQTDLNPKKNKYYLYKTIIIGVIALILFVLFFVYRKIYWFILGIFIVVYLFMTRAPIHKITFDKGIELKILPTENSTIFYKSPQKVTADILLEKDGYTKVLLPNKKIGWIKNEDITKR